MGCCSRAALPPPHLCSPGLGSLLQCGVRRRRNLFGGRAAAGFIVKLGRGVQSGGISGAQTKAARENDWKSSSQQLEKKLLSGLL